MSTIYLIRHGAYDLLGRRLVGRTPGVHLNDEGTQQARRVGERLAAKGIDAIYSSPMERARETAEPLSERIGLRVALCDGLTELEMGGWSDRSLDDLGSDPNWRRWHESRTCANPPGGETILQVQARMIEAVEDLRRQHSSIAIFSHGDPIRTVLAFYAGLHLDMCHRLILDPATISTIRIEDGGPEILALNA